MGKSLLGQLATVVLVLEQETSSGDVVHLWEGKEGGGKKGTCTQPLRSDRLAFTCRSQKHSCMPVDNKLYLHATNSDPCLVTGGLLTLAHLAFHLLLGGPDAILTSAHLDIQNARCFESIR